MKERNPTLPSKPIHTIMRVETSITIGHNASVKQVIWQQVTWPLGRLVMLGLLVKSIIK